MSTQYLITLAGAMDDLPVALFDTRAGVDAFVRTNRPCPVDGRDAAREGPLVEAYDAAGRGPSCVYGYQVWELVDGGPKKHWNRRWVDGEHPGPAKYENMTIAEQTEYNNAEENDPWESNQEEWDLGGEGGA